MSIKAPLQLNTTTYKHTIQEFIPKSLFKTFQNITRKTQLQILGFPQTDSLKPVSQNLGCSNAKTQNIKLVAEIISFPKH